jgi:divalent metal cation (Fe/Co/Zn/Cd) transporter
MRNKVQQNKRLQAVVLMVGTIILVAKFYAWFVTHSNAILTNDQYFGE